MAGRTPKMAAAELKRLTEDIAAHDNGYYQNEAPTTMHAATDAPHAGFEMHGTDAAKVDELLRSSRRNSDWMRHGRRNSFAASANSPHVTCQIRQAIEPQPPYPI